MLRDPSHAIKVRKKAGAVTGPTDGPEETDEKLLKMSNAPRWCDGPGAEDFSKLTRVGFLGRAAGEKLLQADRRWRETVKDMEKSFATKLDEVAKEAQRRYDVTAQHGLDTFMRTATR